MGGDQAFLPHVKCSFIYFGYSFPVVQYKLFYLFSFYFKILKSKFFFALRLVTVEIYIIIHLGKSTWRCLLVAAKPIKLVVTVKL